MQLIRRVAARVADDLGWEAIGRRRAIDDDHRFRPACTSMIGSLRCGLSLPGLATPEQDGNKAFKSILVVLAAFDLKFAFYPCFVALHNLGRLGSLRVTVI
ncbi:hypothetical protein [Xaviernesmea oryzae]|uniref:hypothetical protein n=1 Tax=Xaviernesmea oryzae TaxID=464029 RepID=UPI00111463D9|nr:hypothetical protein [Xaviernesmea oryzae]